jgi:hypothetical protein
MKNIIATISLSLACAAPAVFAQAAAPAAPAAQPAANPASVAAAHELFEAMNYRSIASGMLQQMRQQMPAMIAQSAAAGIENNPKLDAKQKAAEREKISKEMPKAMAMVDSVFGDPTMLDEMLRATEQIYARHFTAAELHQIAAFYKTPVGAKMLATMPQLMGESMQIGQQVVMPRVSAALQKMGKAN